MGETGRHEGVLSLRIVRRKSSVRKISARGRLELREESGGEEMKSKMCVCVSWL